MDHGDGDRDIERELLELGRRIRRSNIVAFVTVMRQLRRIAEAHELIDEVLPGRPRSNFPD